MGLLLFAGTGWVQAQTAAYARPDSGMLRYQEVTSARSIIAAQPDTVVVGYEHDATLALSFAQADTAYAVYEALAVTRTAPDDTTTLDPTPILGDPFVLLFPPDGRLVTIATPAFPSSYAGVADLRRQFADFFVPLPDTALTLGTTWSDSTAHGGGDEPLRVRAGRYTVVADTLVNGERAWIIEGEVQLSATYEGAGPAPGVRVATTMAGSETDRWLFSAERSLLLQRHRTARLDGAIRYLQGGDTVVLPSTRHYESTITLEEPAP